MAIHVYFVTCELLVGITNILKLCDLAVMGWLPLYHCTVGLGKPSATHVNTLVSLTYNTLLEGCDSPSIKTLGASVVYTCTHG